MPADRPDAATEAALTADVTAQIAKTNALREAGKSADEILKELSTKAPVAPADPAAKSYANKKAALDTFVRENEQKLRDGNAKAREEFDRLTRELIAVELVDATKDPHALSDADTVAALSDLIELGLGDNTPGGPMRAAEIVANAEGVFQEDHAEARRQLEMLQNDILADPWLQREVDRKGPAYRRLLNLSAILSLPVVPRKA